MEDQQQQQRQTVSGVAPVDSGDQLAVVSAFCVDVPPTSCHWVQPPVAVTHVELSLQPPEAEDNGIKDVSESARQNKYDELIALIESQQFNDVVEVELLTEPTTSDQQQQQQQPLPNTDGSGDSLDAVDTTGRQWNCHSQLPEMSGEVVVTSSGSPAQDVSTGLRLEVKQKRHVIEEIVLVDSEKYYESLSSSSSLTKSNKKKKKDGDSGATVRATVEPVRPMEELVVAVNSGASLKSVPRPSTSGETSSCAGPQTVTYIVEYDMPARRSSSKNSNKNKSKPSEQPAAVGGATSGDHESLTTADQLQVVAYEVQHEITRERVKDREYAGETIDSPLTVVTTQSVCNAETASVTEATPVTSSDIPLTYTVNYQVRTKKKKVPTATLR